MARHRFAAMQSGAALWSSTPPTAAPFCWRLCHPQAIYHPMFFWGTAIRIGRSARAAVPPSSARLCIGPGLSCRHLYRRLRSASLPVLPRRQQKGGRLYVAPPACGVAPLRRR